MIFFLKIHNLSLSWGGGQGCLSRKTEIGHAREHLANNFQDAKE